MNNKYIVYPNGRELHDFRELLNYSTTTFADNVAYVYKDDYTKKDFKYIEKKFSDVGNDSRALGTKFLDMGLEGKTVVIVGRNRYEWCISYFAITTSNMVVSPLDKALPENELVNSIERSGAVAVIFDDKYKDIMLNMKKTNPNVKYLICMDDIKEEGIITYNSLVEDGRKLLDAGSKIYDNITVDPEKMSIMLFTSGTTSRSKIVMLCQRNICSDITAINKIAIVGPTDTLLSFLPIHHTFECTITFLFGFSNGAKVAFCDGLKHIAKNLQEYKISVFVAVPLVLETMYKKINKGIEEKGKTKLINTLIKVSNALRKVHIDIRRKLFKQILDNFGGNLRIVWFGSAPMAKETIVGFNNFGVETIQGYGLTETSPVITAETDKYKCPGSVGFPLYNEELKIDNPDENGEGEIVVKGPMVMLGYYNDEEKNKEAFTEDGFFRTGDYGYINKEGAVFITGRKKDIIVLKNGKNVYPQEIEFLINEIPFVTESLVYQREEDSTDTMLCAKIVYDEKLLNEELGNKTPDEIKDEIWSRVKEINKNLPIFKHIKKIDVTTEPLAKTTTQKVKRYEELKNLK